MKIKQVTIRAHPLTQCRLKYCSEFFKCISNKKINQSTIMSRALELYVEHLSEQIEENSSNIKYECKKTIKAGEYQLPVWKKRPIPELSSISPFPTWRQLEELIYPQEQRKSDVRSNLLRPMHK